MCRPPTFRRPIDATNTQNTEHTSNKAPLQNFREVFQTTDASNRSSKPLRVTKSRPTLSINTQICRQDSFITIPMNSDDESNARQLKSPLPPYEPAIAVNKAFIRPAPPTPELEVPVTTTVENRAEFAEHLVDTSVALIESIWQTAKSTSQSIPPLRTFVQEFLRRSHCSFSNLQLALLYLVRFKVRLEEQGVILNSKPAISDRSLRPSSSEIMHFAEQYDSHYHEHFQSGDFLHPALRCGRRMFLSALIVACKYLNDKPPSNLAWSQLAGLSLEEISTNERIFMTALSFDLFVVHEVYVKWTHLLLGSISKPDEGSSVPELETDNNSGSSVSSSPSTYYNENSYSKSSSPKENQHPRVSFKIGSSSSESDDDATDYESDSDEFESPNELVTKCKRYGRCYN